MQPWSNSSHTPWEVSVSSPTKQRYWGLDPTWDSESKASMTWMFTKILNKNHVSIKIPKEDIKRSTKNN